MEKRQDQKWRKWFRRDNLIILILSGVLLFIIALPTKKTDGGQGAGASSEFSGGERDAGSAGGAEPGSMSGDTEDYARRQERRLAEILSAMEGVGKVEVMLTISASEELVVEKDLSVSRTSTDERDSAGGNRVTAQADTGRTTVYSTAGGGNSPYVIKTLSPRVEGVFVVAEGAGSGDVIRNITQTVQALFGVEAHRVKVVPMG